MTAAGASGAARRGHRSRLAAIAVIAAAIGSVSLVGGRALASMAIETDSATSTAAFTAGTWSTSSSLYLHNRPTPPTAATVAQFNLAMDSGAPTAVTLYNYDSDCSSGAGRTIRSVSPAAPSQGTTCNYANWRAAASGSTRVLAGRAAVSVWARKTQTGGQDPTLVAYLRDFNPATGVYTELGSASAVVSANPSQAFAALSMSITLSTTLPAGHQLELKLVATGGNRDVDVAYDTTSDPSRLTLP